MLTDPSRKLVMDAPDRPWPHEPNCSASGKHLALLPHSPVLQEPIRLRCIYPTEAAVCVSALNGAIQLRTI